MKRILVLFAAAAFFTAGTAFTIAGHKKAAAEQLVAAGYFDVHFENDCSSDVKLRIEADGSASEGTLYKNSTETHPLREGYKVYVDGKLFLTAEESDAGKTYVVCK